MGTLLSLDKQTSLLNPMKYAGVLIDLKYDSPRPKVIWVSVISEFDKSMDNVMVGVEYSALPQSCSIYRASGHSTTRCLKNLAYTPELTQSKQDSEPTPGDSSNSVKDLSSDTEPSPDSMIPNETTFQAPTHESGVDHDANNP